MSQKRKHILVPSSIRKINAHHLNQWNTERNEAVISIKPEARALTENKYNQTNDTTQTDQQNSQDQIQNTHHREAVQKRDGHSTDHTLEAGRKHLLRTVATLIKAWKIVTVLCSPRASELLYHKIVYQDEAEKYTHAFHPHSSTLIDHYPTFQTDADHGDRHSTPFEQHQEQHTM